MRQGLKHITNTNQFNPGRDYWFTGVPAANG
jgi:hypothetical protein